MHLHFYNSDRWMKCGASVDAPPGEPGDDDDDDTARNEGLAAHWVADGVLHGDATSVDDYLGETHHTGVEITADMLLAIRTYVDGVRDRFAQADEHGSEHDAHVFGVRGRVDAYARTGGHLWIADLKFGYRPPPASSWQMILAALALSDATTDTVTVSICAPRARSGDAWDNLTLRRTDLERYRDLAHRRVLDIDLGDRTAVAGPHCRHCTLAAACGALAGRIEALRDTMDLSELYELRTLIKTRIAATEAEYTGRIRRGQFVPGWELRPQIGTRKWSVDTMTVEVTTGRRATKPVPLSPNEMEQQGVPRRVLDQITHRPVTGVKLARWTATDAASLFGDTDT